MNRTLHPLHWHSFPDYTPITDGWYLCTIKTAPNHKILRTLYWNHITKTWTNPDRIRMFSTYNILDNDGEEVCWVNDSLCECTDEVTAYMRLPKPYK